MQYNFAEEQQHQSQFAFEQGLTRKPIKGKSSSQEHSHHGAKTVKSAANRLTQRPTSFDSHRSLSSCPTYSSLSRHSPATRVRLFVFASTFRFDGAKRFVSLGLCDTNHHLSTCDLIARELRSARPDADFQWLRLLSVQLSDNANRSRSLYSI